MSYGLSLSVNYGWSHFLNDMDGSGWANREGNLAVQNSYVPRQNYSNSNFDVRQAFRGYAIYQLPFGRGKMFLNDNLIADEVLGGWEASSTFIAESGNPMLIVVDSQASNNNANSEPKGDCRRIDRQRQPSPVSQSDGQLQGHGRHNTLVRRRRLQRSGSLHLRYLRQERVAGSGYDQYQLRTWQELRLWPERGVKFQIRASADNVLNHPSFGQPGRNVGYSADSSAITSTTINGRDMEFYGRLSF